MDLFGLYKPVLTDVSSVRKFGMRRDPSQVSELWGVGSCSIDTSRYQSYLSGDRSSEVYKSVAEAQNTCKFIGCLCQ